MVTTSISNGAQTDGLMIQPDGKLLVAGWAGAIAILARLPFTSRW
jgi:hypothetical protein